MPNYTKLEAVKQLQNIGSHTILEDKQEVEDLTKPFNITPFWDTFEASLSNPKGQLPHANREWGESYKGVDIHWIAFQVNEACGGEVSRMLGRGGGFRQSLANAEEAILKDTELVNKHGR